MKCHDLPMPCLPDGDLCGTIAVFLEGGILERVSLVFVAEFLQDGLAEHSLTLAMNENDTLPLVLLVFLEGAAENIKLVIEDVTR